MELPKILLSFDVEEFDMPLEYGHEIFLEEQLMVGNNGIKAITPILDEHQIRCTLFTTANYAKHFPEQISTLGKQHEIASHTYYHSSFEIKHLSESKLELEKIIGRPVYGLRMPRMGKVNVTDIKQAGYSYDSSINPTYLPGRYNNLKLPRTIYKENDILRIPSSVTPGLRIPLFWIAFKNMPYFIYRKLCLRALKKDGYVCLYFHPWEFTDLKKYKVPNYTKRMSGQPLAERLNKLITDLKNDGEFDTFNSFLLSSKFVSSPKNGMF